MKGQCKSKFQVCGVVPVKRIEVGGADQNTWIPSERTMGHPLRVQRGGGRVRLTTAPLPKVKKTA